MALTIKKGETFKAENVRHGSNDKGTWFLCKIKPEKGKSDITIWNFDGFCCGEGDVVRVNDITEVSRANRKYNEKWYEDFKAVCDLEVVMTANEAFAEIADEDGELPF